MQYVHLALALHSAGKPVSEDNIKKMCSAVGVKTDDGQIKALIAVLEDVDIDQAVKTAPVGMMAAAPTSAAPTSDTPAQDEVKEEEPEAAGDDMGLDSLFG